MTEPDAELRDALDRLDAAYEQLILKLKDHHLGSDHALTEPLDSLLICVGRVLEYFGPG
jgi:hypothetical protein